MLLNKKVSLTIKNGNFNYFVIVCDDEKADKPKNLLLQRLFDGEFIIANDVIWLNELEVYWSKGNYFGRNLTSAAATFFDTVTGEDIKNMLESALESSKTIIGAYCFLVGWMISRFKNNEEISSVLNQLLNLK